MSIKIEGLSIEFSKKKVVDIESLEIEKGKFHAIVGMNGSGKTSLIKALINIIPQSCIKGSVMIENIPISLLKGKKLAEKIAYVPQKLLIEYDFSVEELIKMGGYRYKSESDALYHTVIERFNLGEFENRSILTLSGGEFQRVQIARALYQNSPIIALDEPTAALDVSHSIELYQYLAKLVSEEGKTVVLVTHDLSFISNYCDNLIVMSEGKVVCKGEAQEVLNEKTLCRYFKFYGNLERIGGSYTLVEKKI